MLQVVGSILGAELYNHQISDTEVNHCIALAMFSNQDEVNNNHLLEYKLSLLGILHSTSKC
jgi:hypothetical protein